MITTAKQARREAKRLFGVCMVNGKLDQHRVRQGVQAAIQSRRRGYMAVLRHFQRLLKFESDRHTAGVESAIAVPAELQSKVRSRIEQLYGSGITTHFALNPDLIAGMRIKIGNDVYDGSVQSALRVLAKSFGITDYKRKESNRLVHRW